MFLTFYERLLFKQKEEIKASSEKNILRLGNYQARPYVPLRVRELDSNGGFVFEYILDADVKEEKNK